MAHAETVSERPDSTSLTIYASGGGQVSPIEEPSDLNWARESGLALVTETRTVDLPAGPSELRFRNVVSTMVPQTADIKGLPEGSVERNFGYDLLSPGSLLAKSIGATVHLWRTNPKTGERTDQIAIVRSGPAGPMFDVEGKLEALRCSGLAERLVFDKVPDGLVDVPTLSVRIDLPEAARYRITLTYLATALGWSSDYVAQVHPERGTLDLSGWITLANFSETSFDNVPVQFVAGAVNTTGDDEPVSGESLTIAKNCWQPPSVTAVGQQELKFEGMTGPDTGLAETVVVTGSRIPDPRVLGDYKLYTLPEPTSVGALQIKQIQFLEQREVPFRRIYSFPAQNDYPNEQVLSDTANMSIRLQNRADQGLGKPLPAGRVAVSELNASGGPILLGEGQMGNVAAGLPVEFGIGNAMGVYVEQRVLESHKVSDGKNSHTVNTFEVDIDNQKPAAIDFELQHAQGGTGFRVISEDHPHRIVPLGITWDFHLDADQKVRTRFTVDEGQF
jgi:hypothetical protein